MASGLKLHWLQWEEHQLAPAPTTGKGILPTSQTALVWATTLLTASPTTTLTNTAESHSPAST